MFKSIRILVTHGIALGVGFALGIYLLPILTAPEAPSKTAVDAGTEQAIYRAEFRRDLPGSDFLHWGEGEIAITADKIGFIGSLAPGPDYQLYLTRELVLNEGDFLEVKQQSARIGAVKTFENFILDLPPGIDLGEYGAVLVWCETFSEFITAGAYR
ncbi:MAG: DM13 domain-containing protein [Gammaproteobacteria bacterium]|jgi:hypothetical protein